MGHTALVPDSWRGGSPESEALLPQETSDKSVIELQQYAKKNKPNLHILSKLQEEMKRLAEERVSMSYGSFMLSISLSQDRGRALSCLVLW